MFNQLPDDAREFMDWPWEKIKPFYDDLASRPLTAETVEQFLKDWDTLSNLMGEVGTRLNLATSRDTTDEEARKRYTRFLEEIVEPAEPAGQAVVDHLLESGVEPDGFEMPLRKMRTRSKLFREQNVPLDTRVTKLEMEYDKIVGAQTVEWEGEEVTLIKLGEVLEDTDRDRREKAWRARAERQLADRDAINENWVKMLELRLEMARNADAADYREYVWGQKCRFDYTPHDCVTFHEAIESHIVPLARDILEHRASALGVDTLRPWDLDVDPTGRAALRPFSEAEELAGTGESVFRRVDPRLGDYFGRMRREELLDLPNRKGKAPGAFCTGFPVLGVPYVFMNATGKESDIRTLLHEAGHAFHVFEARSQPYRALRGSPMEFAEVASMSMELLAAPYLTKDQGGFFSQGELARAMVGQLERMLLFWPYMAVVDAFQHWVYENPQDAADTSQCDGNWAEIWDRFMPVTDYSGLDDVKETGWHRKLHIHCAPFYYVEYGLAQLGSAQVWGNALRDQGQAVGDYLAALALGSSVPLPELFETAGARFGFGSDTVAPVVSLLGAKLEEYRAKDA
ncbi:MAG: M3 family oligoendopeptidase [Armatimonadia bacterium]|nr:M3 family oligoendopeptidase [Armatimonadia bacterium]